MSQKPARKKSNSPQAARELKEQRSFAGRSLYGRTLPHSRAKEYARITSTSLAIYFRHGRPAALDYLGANRPWLADYCSWQFGGHDFPSSGALLDGLLKELRDRLKKQ